MSNYNIKLLLYASGNLEENSSEKWKNRNKIFWDSRNINEEIIK